MQKIIPHLWFDNQAEEAAKFYTSIFKNSKIGSISRYDEAGAKASGRPKGSVMTVTFELERQQFIALNGGPVFTFTSAVSFFASYEDPQEIDELWRRLSDGGTVLMELDKYPFAEKYGWIQDKYGVSWQLILASRTQKIAPFLMFVGAQRGKAEEAMKFYISLFRDSDIISIERYGKGEQGPEGKIVHAVFSLDGQEFMAMDGAIELSFTFTEAISFFVNCKTQEEVDELWKKLTEGGEEGQCGWLKDKFGLSWQIVPTVLGEMLADKDPEKAQRVMKAMLQMKKLDIKGLKQAYEQG